MLSFEKEEEDLTWGNELLSTSTLEGKAYSDPALEPPPLFPGEDWDRPLPASPTPLSQHQASLALERNTSRTCSACLGGFMPTNSMRHCRPCSVGSLLARFLLRQRKKNRKPRQSAPGLRVHRWGISLPGACEGLCHWRGTIEPLAANGTLEQLVAADLDLVNVFGNAEWPCIRQVLRTHFPEASAWTEWQHQADSVTSPSPAPPTGRPSRAMCLALFRVRSCWGKRATRTLGSSSPTLSRPPRASATNGSLMTGRCPSVLFSLIPSSVLWTLLLPPSVPPGCAPHTPTSRAPRARNGARRTCTTPLTSSPQSRAPRRWGQPLDPASTSTHERGNRCEPATRCTPRLAALIKPPRRRSSPGSAQTCRSSCIACASMGTSLTKICWSRVTGSCGPLSAPPSTAICPTTLGGRPPQVSRAADWASARRRGLRSLPSWPVASCAAPWCPPWSTTSASLWRLEPVRHDRV